jgi:hypothetical protein
MRASWGGKGSDRQDKRRRRTADDRHFARACKHVQACASMWLVFQVTTILSHRLTWNISVPEHTPGGNAFVDARTPPSCGWAARSGRGRSHRSVGDKPPSRDYRLTRGSQAHSPVGIRVGYCTEQRVPASIAAICGLRKDHHGQKRHAGRWCRAWIHSADSEQNLRGTFRRSHRDTRLWGHAPDGSPLVTECAF